MANRLSRDRPNLLATFGEQLYRVQPEFEKARAYIRLLGGQMTISNPAQNTKALANYPDGDWGDVYTRMGIDRAKAPPNPYDVSPDTFPQLLPPSDPRFTGTLGSALTVCTILPTSCSSLKQFPSASLPHSPTSHAKLSHAAYIRNFTRCTFADFRRPGVLSLNPGYFFRGQFPGIPVDKRQVDSPREGLLTD